MVPRRALPQPRLPLLRPRAEQRPLDSLPGDGRSRRRHRSRASSPASKDQLAAAVVPPLLHARRPVRSRRAHRGRSEPMAATPISRPTPANCSASIDGRDGPRAAHRPLSRVRPATTSAATACRSTIRARSRNAPTIGSRSSAARTCDLPPPSQSGASTNWRQDVASGWQGGVR